MSPRPGNAHLLVALAWRVAMALVAAGALFVAATIPPIRSTPGIGASGAGIASGAPAMNQDTGPHNTSFPAIAEHPLFYPSRTPWSPPPPPKPPVVAKAPSPLTKYALVGVVVSGETRSAIIRPSGAAKNITLAEGQGLDGWTLQEITSTSLRFAAGTASYEMTFPKPSETRR
jgi:hypothetical protein